MRGGSWNNESRNVRVANRNRNTPSNQNNNLGFRCARSLPQIFPARMLRLYGRAAHAAEVSAGATRSLDYMSGGQIPKSLAPCTQCVSGARRKFGGKKPGFLGARVVETARRDWITISTKGRERHERDAPGCMPRPDGGARDWNPAYTAKPSLDLANWRTTSAERRANLASIRSARSPG